MQKRRERESDIVNSPWDSAFTEMLPLPFPLLHPPTDSVTLNKVKDSFAAPFIYRIYFTKEV